MTIEYIPKGLLFLQNHPERLKHREGDVTCNKCGVLGENTLGLNEAIQVAKDHTQENPDHIVKVVEVVCFM